MFCPACGAKNTNDHRFCRSCGMNLEPAAQSIREQFPTGGRPDIDRSERRLEKFGQVAFTGFTVVGGLALLGLIYAILDRMVFSGDNPLFGLMLMAFIIFAGLALTYVILRESLKEKRKEAAAQPVPPELGVPAVTGKLLEERDFEPVPTVTENTTNLLPVPRDER